MNKQNNICLFCGKNNLQVEKLVASKEAAICNECLNLSLKAIEQEKKESFITDNLSDLSPKTLKKEFDKYVIGQEEAKKQLAVIVSNHYKRLMHQEENEIKDDKINLLMIGPTSSGKTLLLKILQKFLSKKGIPVAFADATTLTEAGYVGDDVESILLRLLQEADYNVNKAQKGILFIDEIDKIASHSSENNSTKDISGKGVQHALLSILQGTLANVSLGSKKNTNQETITIDTSDILFICAGAFSGLEKIIENRLNIYKIGFHGKISEKSEVKNYNNVLIEDLIKFGLIPEFLGRLPANVTLSDLTKKELIEVLTKTENSIIKQYKKLFEINNAKLIFESEAIEEIAELTLKTKVSTRGLRGIIESILKDTMYELEDLVPCKVIVTKESVINKKPIIEKQEEEKLEVVSKSIMKS